MKFNKLLPYLAGSRTSTSTGTQIVAYISSISFNTDPMPIHGVYGYSLQISWPATGSPVGVFKIQHSDDPEMFEMQIDPSITTWTDVTNATVSVTAGGGNGIIEVFSASRWVRLVYTAGSGTGTFTVRGHIKSMQ